MSSTQSYFSSQYFDCDFKNGDWLVLKCMSRYGVGWNGGYIRFGTGNLNTFCGNWKDVSGEEEKLFKF